MCNFNFIDERVLLYGSKKLIYDIITLLVIYIKRDYIMIFMLIRNILWWLFSIVYKFAF
jgi:hypothetical protein